MPLTKPFRRFPGECCRKLLCKLAEIWVMWHAKELEEGIRHQMCRQEFFCSHRLRLRLLHPTLHPKAFLFCVQLNVRPFELGKYRCTLNGIAFLRRWVVE